MTDYTLTEEEWTALSEAANEPDGRGEEFQLASNVDAETDNVRVRRVGPAKGGLKARACVYIESLVEHEDEDVEDEIQSTLVYISAPEARQLAAALLNVADEIDGKTPLVFFPRLPNGEEAPEAEEPTAATVAGASLMDFATVTGDTGDTCHSFKVGERVQVVNLWVTVRERQPVADCRSLSRPNLTQIVAQADLDTVGSLSEEDGN